MQLNSTWSVIIAAIPALLAIMSGLAKLAAAPAVVSTLTKVGVIQYLKVLGIAEIIFALLFVYPPTNLIGFVLLACYFSGALAVDLSHKNKIAPPLIILIILFVAEALVKGALFLP